MKVSALIPYKPDRGWRDHLWQWNREQWTRRCPKVEVVLGVDDSTPFNAGRAINRAGDQATGDVFVTVAADFLPDPDAINGAFRELEAGATWCALWQWTMMLTEASTIKVLAGSDDPYEYSLHCQSNHAGHMVTRDAWFDVGGVDERFEGWGPEDLAFRVALDTLHGTGTSVPGTCVHLWHPRRERGIERQASGVNHDFYASTYVPAIGDKAAMRRVVEEAKAYRHG